MKLANPQIDSNIKSSDVRTAIKGVIKIASENLHLQKQLFREDFPLFLQINAFKIPKTRGASKQVHRIPLVNSPLASDADVCLIVPDVKGIPNKEHEVHLEHYEKLLRAKGITGIKKIMTFHEFRTEYDTFELKNRLADLYDLFLVDGKISGKVVNKCGSIFYKKRKVPISIKLQATNLKSDIEKCLKKTFFLMTWKSDSHAVQIGNSKMKVKNLVENVYSVVEFIEKQFPGKMENIRSLNIYAYRGSSIPIYISMKNPNEVPVPKQHLKEVKNLHTVSGELTTRYNAKVIVKPSGRVIVEHLKNIKENKIDEQKLEVITDADIKANKIADKVEKVSVDEKPKLKKRKLEDAGLIVKGQIDERRNCEKSKKVKADDTKKKDTKKKATKLAKFKTKSNKKIAKV